MKVKIQPLASSYKKWCSDYERAITDKRIELGYLIKEEDKVSGTVHEVLTLEVLRKYLSNAGNAEWFIEADIEGLTLTYINDYLD